MVRFNPQGTKLLAARARIAEGFGYDSIGCDNGFLAEVEDMEEFFEAMCDCGHHYVWAYGDLTGALEKLGNMIGFETKIV